MNVRELIELLQKEDPDALVVTPGYEGDYDTVTEVCKVNLALNWNDEEMWYYGRHKQVDKEEADCTAVLILGRHNQG